MQIDERTPVARRLLCCCVERVQAAAPDQCDLSTRSRRDSRVESRRSNEWAGGD